MALTYYFELRKTAARGSDSLTADVMRHLHTRQHLGKAVIICDDPAAVLGPARKQWLKLSRTLQKQRASTLNADKILKYTHAVTRMQRMHFSGRSPLEQADADIYFLRPTDIQVMPANCWTVYMLGSLAPKDVLNMILQLPAGSLMVDYRPQQLEWVGLGLQPKKNLETEVETEWKAVREFLGQHNIDPTQMIVDGVHNVEAMDDALDTLLGGHAHAFLQVADRFQQALQLARPLRLTKPLRASYDSLILLAHRVQALTPGAFEKRFLEVYNEDDTFFLYDPARGFRYRGSESLAEVHARHTRAGRHNLARSFQALAQGSPA
jgi:hypothetical protein